MQGSSGGHYSTSLGLDDVGREQALRKRASALELLPGPGTAPREDLCQSFLVVFAKRPEPLLVSTAALSLSMTYVSGRTVRALLPPRMFLSQTEVPSQCAPYV